jgi:hypothetical protein
MLLELLSAALVLSDFALAREREMWISSSWRRALELLLSTALVLSVSALTCERGILDISAMHSARAICQARARILCYTLAVKVPAFLLSPNSTQQWLRPVPMPERVGDEEAVLLAPRRPLVGGGVGVSASGCSSCTELLSTSLISTIFALTYERDTWHISAMYAACVICQARAGIRCYTFPALATVSSSSLNMADSSAVGWLMGFWWGVVRWCVWWWPAFGVGRLPEVESRLCRCC